MKRVALEVLAVEFKRTACAGASVRAEWSRFSNAPARLALTAHHTETPWSKQAYQYDRQQLNQRLALTVIALRWPDMYN